MKLYLSSMYSKRDELRSYSRQLQELGHEITSTWLQETERPLCGITEVGKADLIDIANRDVFDIHRSEAIVIIEPSDNDLRTIAASLQSMSEPEALAEVKRIVRAGREFEMGMAFALNLRVFLVGRRLNAFHYHPNVQVFTTFDKFLDHITGQSYYIRCQGQSYYIRCQEYPNEYEVLDVLSDLRVEPNT